MAESLEEILEKATNPNSIGDNTIYANAFSNQVNKEFDGPIHAIKLIAQKLQLHQQAVSLQTLNVLENCVKNCGKRFHQEIGKYRFLNELIKLLSPKYDGDVTSQVVKDRVTELLYNWYVGLPTEGKISEAYKMLKQQGVIKRDPIDDDPDHRPAIRPTNTALDDEEKSQLLSTLLKSTNPEDLQAANKLIKTMVKQEEERLEKFSKRVQELETVSNNVTLLNEMIGAFNPAMSESDQSVMRDLYESCLSMRTQLFRMASQCAEDKDDTLSEILSLSDDLTKAIDEYKRVVIQREPPTQPQVEHAQLSTDNTKQPQPSADSLLDIGLDFAEAPKGTTSEAGASSASLLDEQLKMLGLDGNASSGATNVTNSHASSKDNWGDFGAGSLQYQQPNMQSHGQFYMNNPMNTNFAGMTSMAQMAPSSNMAAGNFSMPMVQQFRPATSSASATTATTQTRQQKQTVAKNSSNDILGLDVFAEFKKGAKSKTVDNVESTSSEKPTDSGALLDFNDDAEKNVHPVTLDNKYEKEVSTAKATNSSADGGYFVPLEAIEPSSHSPITVLDKDGLRTILNFVKDKRKEANPNVNVVVFSTLSTNTLAISEFRIEVSVSNPKAVRIKLQSPSSSALPPFNPLLPPSAITQIMLIANPSKENNIWLLVRISYKAASQDKVETVKLDNLPIL